jgi:signal peptidase
MIEQTVQPRTKYNLARHCRSLFVGSLVPVLTIAIATVILSIVLTRVPISGYRAVILAGGSMEPSLDNGSMLITQRAAPLDMEPGDVITFRHPDSSTTITHRIVSVREEGGARWFTLKGDANATADPNEVAFEQGRAAYRTVFAIPYLGYVLDFVAGRLGILLLLVAPALGLGALQFLGDERRKADRGA